MSADNGIIPLFLHLFPLLFLTFPSCCSFQMVDPVQQRRSVIPISLLVRMGGNYHPFADMILPPLQDLRAQLTAVVNSSQQQQHHHQGPPPGLHGYSDPRASSSASPHDHNIDPAIGGPGGMMSAGPGGDNDDDDSMGDGRKGGKRELSQSKRAAQNRAAQVCRNTTTPSLCRVAMLGAPKHVWQINKMFISR